jgi:hypothetical protein
MAASDSNPLEPSVVLFETSPDGSLDAILQQDGRTLYLYLNDPRGDFGTRACWVGNLAPAPLELSTADLRSGVPPLLPRFFANHPAGRPAPRQDDFRVVWFEEGNGIALFERDELLAVIPPWSGQDGFHGYARDCLHENEVCWPLPSKPALLERIRRAEGNWRAWKTGNPLAELQADLLPKYRNRLGTEDRAFRVDQDHWPPLLIFQFGLDVQARLVTAGMSLRPQPNVELAEAAPAALRRIELAVACGAHTAFQTPGPALELLAGQARYPWRRWNWLGHGHLSRLTHPDQTTSNVLFVADSNSGGALTRFRGDPVNLLWLVPLSEEDLQAYQQDSAAWIQACRTTGRLIG